MTTRHSIRILTNGVRGTTLRIATLAASLAGLGACTEPTSPDTALGAPSSASYDWRDGDSDRDSERNSYRNAPARAVSYINPDIGAATANADVNANSNCFTPDQSDTQRLSPANTTTNNVHNDACFFNWWGDTKIDGPASFESFGVGIISACPDPDGAGPKVAILSADRKRCFQSGFQEKGIAGDREFHARLNNTTTTGTQTVVWCYDPERDGCSNTRVKSTIQINWIQ